jgi:lactate dehydrogenase-like 2-hydroxyacid dehydrogenase
VVVPDDWPPVLATSFAFQELRDRSELECFDTLPGSAQGLIKRIGSAEVVVNIRASSKLNEEVFERCPKVRLVSVWGTGTDHVDLEAARRRKVAVTNTPTVSADSAAE